MKNYAYHVTGFRGSDSRYITGFFADEHLLPPPCGTEQEALELERHFTDRVGSVYDFLYVVVVRMETKRCAPDTWSFVLHPREKHPQTAYVWKNTTI